MNESRNKKNRVFLGRRRSRRRRRSDEGVTLGDKECKKRLELWIHEQEKLVLKELGDVIDRYNSFFFFF